MYWSRFSRETEPPVDLLLGIESRNFVSQVPGPAGGALEAQETLQPAAPASELRAETRDSCLCPRDGEAGALVVSTTVQGRRRLTPQVSRWGTVEEGEAKRGGVQESRKDGGGGGEGGREGGGEGGEGGGASGGRGEGPERERGREGEPGRDAEQGRGRREKGVLPSRPPPVG